MHNCLLVCVGLQYATKLLRSISKGFERINGVEVRSNGKCLKTRFGLDLALDLRDCKVNRGEYPPLPANFSEFKRRGFLRFSVRALSVGLELALWDVSSFRNCRIYWARPRSYHPCIEDSLDSPRS